MPHNQYIPANHPPTFWDRILANPYGVPLGFMAMFLGPMILLTVVTDLEVSNSLAQSSEASKVWLGALFTVGGPVSLVGIFNPRQKLSDIWAMITELIGTVPLVFGTLSFTFKVMGSGNPLAVVTVVVTLAIAAGWTFRCVGLFISEKRSREPLERQPMTKE